MTKTKQRGQRYPTRRTGAATSETAARALNAPLGIFDYVLLNLVFDAFCLLQLGLMSTIMNEMPGLVFFFVFIMLGFLLVSVFDYLAGRLTTEDAAAPEMTNASGEAV